MTTFAGVLHNTPDMPRLSIVINNYNYARYLPEALDSALRQMQEGDELIVVDDGSTDESPSILKQYQVQHGILLIQQQNQGQMRAVRVGIAAAQCDVVVLLDSDDYFLDGYLDRLRQIYTERPEISYVFCNALIGGDSGAGRESMRAILKRMELTPGNVGITKWAALLFHEFVGIPTSGNSLRRSLANTIMTLPAAIDETWVIPPLLARLLGISKTEQQKSGFSADGVIVRSASLLESLKHYDERPGFMYRIHGSNKYATVSRLGRWYLLRRRNARFSQLAAQHFVLSRAPTAMELHEEVLGRAYGRRFLRRVWIRGRYCRAILVSRGNVAQKLTALAAAMGLHRSKHAA